MVRFTTETMDSLEENYHRPIIERKTREGSSGDSNETGAVNEEETTEIDEPIPGPISPSHAHVFAKPMQTR